jgi:hypothetical protein
MNFNNLTISQIDSMRRTALRELDKRRTFYPRWIQAGKMAQGKADYEIKAMQEIVDYFNWLKIHATPEQQTLF